MKISVIIPTYKPQSYLWECLDSLRCQTFPKDDFEILLILNGCKEPYQSQIEDYLLMNEMHNLRLLQTSERGVSNARNIGLDCAKGDYIAFIDDDDYVSYSYLEELYKIVSPDTISLCYPYAFNDGKPEIQLPYYITEAYEYCKHQEKELRISSMVRKYFSGPCMKLIPANFINERRFDIQFHNGEDSLFMFLISDCFANFNIAASSAIYYRRIRKGSAITSKRSFIDKTFNSLRLIVSITKIYIVSFPKYDFLFYLTRIFAVVKSIIRSLF